MAKKVEVKAVDKDGNEVTYYAVKPKAKELSLAKLHSNKAFRDGVRDKLLSRDMILDYLKSLGLWGEEQDKEQDFLENKINDGLKELKRGGDLETGYKLSVEIANDRMKLNTLLSKQREFDNFSIEATIDNASMDSLAASCIKDEEGNCVFKTVDDYINCEEEWVEKASAEVAKLAFGLDTDQLLGSLPENKFLKHFGFMDDEYRLKDFSKENFVSLDGRRIDEEGYFLEDKEGNPIEPDKEDDKEFLQRYN